MSGRRHGAVLKHPLVVFCVHHVSQGITWKLSEHDAQCRLHGFSAVRDMVVVEAVVG
jgi:hypothetical protein